MIKLETSKGVFGPFASVIKLGDRYRCDGADLPFVVVNDDGVVSEWDLPNHNPIPIYVPSVISMAQARLALLKADKLASVDAAIASLPSPEKEAAKIEWEYRTEIRRNNPLVSKICFALGMSDADIDSLFSEAVTL